MKNTTIAITFLLASASTANAAQLSDFQGRDHIPDTDLNNCARQALIDHAHGGNGMTQDTYTENGATVYHFETAGPNGEETFLDVVVGAGREVGVYTKGGSPSARKEAILAQIKPCMQ